LDVPRDELPQGSLNDMDMTCNAQAFINISRKRLCSRASKETREA
jgi:thymidylate synthase ThyX